MGREKLSMKLISNEKSRKSTFYKRKTSLLRKAYELSTLCDVRVCVVVHGPNQNDQSPLQVHTWPSCRHDVNDMIASYKANCLHKRAHKTFGLLDFFSGRKKKVETEISKLWKDVAEVRFSKWDERLDHLLEDQLRVLLVELDLKLEMTKRRIEMESENNNNNVEEWTSGESSQTLNNVNMAKEESYEMMFGRRSSMEEQTQALMPLFHQQYDHQQLQMDHEVDNLSQIQNHPNFYTDPTLNGMFMMDHNTQQSTYSMCHYGLPFATQSILPLPYMQMQLTNDQMKMMASNSQMPLLNNYSSTQLVNDPFDYFNNYEYFINPSNL